MKKDKKNIDNVLKDIRSKFGEDSVMCLGDVAKVDVAAVSTGSLGLDLAMGIGGLPRGRIIEIFGPESSGKTTLCLHTIAEAQKSGGLCAFIDAESSPNFDLMSFNTLSMFFLSFFTICSINCLFFFCYFKTILLYKTLLLLPDLPTA